MRDTVYELEVYSEELDELVQYCKWYWTTIRGVSGYQVYGPNGESIFLPAAGRYIEKSRVNDGLMGCYRSSSKVCLSFHKSISANPGSVGGGEERRFGASVRPVWGAR